jgi:hypothetical protein
MFENHYIIMDIEKKKRIMSPELLEKLVRARIKANEKRKSLS